MYAIIETGGKQLKVKENDVVFIEKLETNEKGEVVFDKVVFIGGEKQKIGKPYVKDAKVSGVVEKQGKGKKITIFKFKRKQGYHLKQGHRQPYSKVKITKIEG